MRESGAHIGISHDGDADRVILCDENADMVDGDEIMAIAAIDFLLARGAVDVTAVCLIASPEGLAAVEKAMVGRDVSIVLGAVDEKLNELGYIVPGLGDAGDRLYGLV